MTAFDSTGASTFATVLATTSRIPLEGHRRPPPNSTTTAQTGLDCEGQANKDERPVRMPLEKTLIAGRPAIATGDLSSASGSTLDHFHQDVSTDVSSSVSEEASDTTRASLVTSILLKDDQHTPVESLFTLSVPNDAKLCVSARFQQTSKLSGCGISKAPLPRPIVPVLDPSLGIPEVEYRLDQMRRNVLEDRSELIYIPLRAKANLLASGKKSFLLTDAMHEFLESDRQVFLLLGDSGSGKSTFCRQFVRELWKNYKHGGRIPMYVDLRDTGRLKDELIETRLQESGLSEADIRDLRKRQFVLVCDGYDESRLATKLYTKRLCQMNVKMIVSCRNTYLGHDYQGRFLPFSDNKYDDKSSEQFQEATIVPFSESDIHDYVKQHVLLAAAQEPSAALSASSYDDIWNKLKVIPNLMNLVSNPFLLTLALRALPSQSIEALRVSELEAMQHHLYDGFMQEWGQVGRRRLDGTDLESDVREAFNNLLNDGFVGCVTDYSKNLADAIYSYQDGIPVVKFSWKHNEEWKVKFFGPDIRVTLLREASPLTRAGIRHWFIHKSLLDYLYSRTFFDPDDSDDYDSDDDDDDPQGGGDESPGGGGNSFGGDGDGLVDDSDGGNGGDSGATAGSAELTGSNGGSSGGNGGSSGGNGGSSGGNGGSSGGNGGSSGGNGGSSGGNGGSSGGSTSGNHDSASSGGISTSDSSGGSFGGNGDGSHGDKNGSNGDEDGSRRRKDDVRSKRKGTSTKSRLSTSSDPFSKRNLFKEPLVLQFLVERARSDPRLKKRLFSTIKEAKSSSVPSLAAANSITILFKSGERFQEVDLNGVYVPSDYMSTKSIEPILHAERDLTGGELIRALMTPPVSTPTPAVSIPTPAVSTPTPAITAPTPADPVSPDQDNNGNSNGNQHQSSSASLTRMSGPSALTHAHLAVEDVLSKKAIPTGLPTSTHRSGDHLASSIATGALQQQPQGHLQIRTNQTATSSEDRHHNPHSHHNQQQQQQQQQQLLQQASQQRQLHVHHTHSSYNHTHIQTNDHASREQQQQSFRTSNYALGHYHADPGQHDFYDHDRIHTDEHVGHAYGHSHDNPAALTPPPSSPSPQQDLPPLTYEPMTAKKNPHTSHPPTLPLEFMEELTSKLDSKITNHQKNLNSDFSDLAESETETESDCSSNSDSDFDSESESEQESENEYEPFSSPPARIKKRAKAVVKKVQKQSISTDVTTIVMIGNPGVGKSTLLNVLGGKFESGFSLVEGLTKSVTIDDVELQGRRLRLVDMPGINEADPDTTEANLIRLQEQLSNEGSYVLFFVVAPMNGRIGPKDFGLISLVLKKLQRGPTVGLIITQVPDDQITQIQDPKYASVVVQQLKNSKAKTTLLEQKNMLILPRRGTFNDEEKQKVFDYVLSFEPKQVKIRRLSLRTFEEFKAFFMGIFKGKSTSDKKIKGSTEKRDPQAA